MPLPSFGHLPHIRSRACRTVDICPFRLPDVQVGFGVGGTSASKFLQESSKIPSEEYQDSDQHGTSGHNAQHLAEYKPMAI